MDELKEKIKQALDESETYGDFCIKLLNMPEFIETAKGLSLCDKCQANMEEKDVFKSNMR